MLPLTICGSLERLTQPEISFSVSLLTVLMLLIRGCLVTISPAQEATPTHIVTVTLCICHRRSCVRETDRCSGQQRRCFHSGTCRRSACPSRCGQAAPRRDGRQPCRLGRLSSGCCPVDAPSLRPSGCPRSGGGGQR